MKKRGWLVVNGFLATEKFLNIYDFLSSAADALDLQLEVKKNTDLYAVDFGKERLPDFVLFWDKDIPLAKRLEGAGVPLFNSAKAVEISDSKVLTALCLEGKVKTPKTLFSPKTYEVVGYGDCAFLEEAEKTLGFPFVIKEEFGSFGAQVYLAKDMDEAKSIVKSLGAKPFIMQQFIKESAGRDVRINVVADKVNSAMVRQNTADFRSNITNGGAATAYMPTKEEAEIALKAAQAIGLDFAGVDVLFGKDGPLVCEVNSNPHFKSTYDCTGVDMSISIMAHIKEKIS